MKNLKINDMMAWDMWGFPYFVVYAESETEWWILRSCETLDEANKHLAIEMLDGEEGDEGEFMVIDHEGHKVEG